MSEYGNLINEVRELTDRLEFVINNSVSSLSRQYAAAEYGGRVGVLFYSNKITQIDISAKGNISYSLDGGNERSGADRIIISVDSDRRWRRIDINSPDNDIYLTISGNWVKIK